MRRPEGVALALLGAALLLCTHARAAGAGQPAEQADEEGAEELPSGHPPVGGEGNPHEGAAGHGGSNAPPGMFDPPPDLEQPDPSQPPGTITVELRDADDKPVPREQLTLGVLVNSVAKGDSRKHLQATTDERGRAVFSNLETASNIAYRVSSGYQGGAFAATPFQLQQAKSMRVVLHVYPVTRDIQQALVVAEATVAAEVREDRIQIEEALTFYNLGRTAWQPDAVTMTLPEGFTAFNSQASMSDQGVDADGALARLRGTFPPGRHSIEFRWQLPWSGDKDVDFAVGLPPHVAIARVMMPATSDIKLVAQGFPPTEVKHDQQGQSFLVTERRLRPDEPKLATLMLGIHDLPTSGPGRMLATLLAACGLLAGVWMAVMVRPGARKGSESAVTRASLLEELAELEDARAAGEVGPKTYERARRELLEALARVLAHA